jgi:hypothetical protein
MTLSWASGARCRRRALARRPRDGGPANRSTLMDTQLMEQQPPLAVTTAE